MRQTDYSGNKLIAGYRGISGEVDHNQCTA